MSIAQCKRNIRVAQVMSVQQPSTALSLTSAYNNVLSARCLRRIRQYLCPSIVQIETPQKFSCCLESCGRCDAICNQNVHSVNACLHKPTISRRLICRDKIVMCSILCRLQNKREVRLTVPSVLTWHSSKILSILLLKSGNIGMTKSNSTARFISTTFGLMHLGMPNT